MKKIFLAAIAAVCAHAAMAQEVEYFSTNEVRCDGVVVACLEQVSDPSSGSCVLTLPNGNGMEYSYASDSVVEFGEFDSHLYDAGGDWTDILVILDDFLDRNDYAPWNGADEPLSNCAVVS
jgi:hypothetical protein